MADIPAIAIAAEQAKSENRPYTNSINKRVVELAGQLDKALAINAAVCKTNPNQECLLISAFLNPNIAGASSQKPIQRVLLYHLGTTPVPRAWCEDFSDPGRTLVQLDPMDEGLLFGREKSATAVFAAAPPLDIPKSRQATFTLARPKISQGPIESGPPARIERFTPEQADAVIGAVVSTVLRPVAPDQAEARFCDHVEKLLREAFATGCNSPAFTITQKDTFEEEAAKNLVAHAYRHLLSRVIRQENGYFFIMETAVGRFQLVQMRGPLTVSVSRRKVSELETANRLRWAGGFQVKFASVGRVCRNGRWGNWEQMSGEVEEYGIVHQSGIWDMTWLGKARFYRPSPRQIADALSR